MSVNSGSMNRFIGFLLLLFPLLASGQISFVKRHLAYDGVQRISKPLELANGYFVCSAIVSHNNMWVNVIYLFSECGELVTTLPISLPEEYLVISDLMNYNSESFLATGYSSDSTFHTINLVLDNQTLEVLQDKRYFGNGLIDVGNAVQDNGRIYHLGVIGYDVVSNVMNLELQRNLHLYRYYENLSEASFNGLFFIAAFPNRLYTLERYKNYKTNQVFDVLRCQDQKLITRYEIGGHFDTIYNKISGTIGFLESDTLLVAIEERSLDGQTLHKYVRKYHKDSILWQREVSDFLGISTYSTCVFDSGTFKCIDGDGTVAWFDRQGEEIFFTDHLPTVLGGASMGGAILTDDGGWFVCTPTYATIEGESRSVLRIIKTNGNYEISETPHPKCIVSTHAPEIDPGIQLFPNPTFNVINIQSERIILKYKLYSSAAVLLKEGNSKTKEFTIELDLPPGLYTIAFEFEDGVTTQKFLVIQ
jgi:hypothetical protein